MRELCHWLHVSASVCLLFEGLETPAVWCLSTRPGLSSRLVVGCNLKKKYFHYFCGVVNLLVRGHANNVPTLEKYLECHKDVLIFFHPISGRKFGS